MDRRKRKGDWVTGRVREEIQDRTEKGAEEFAQEEIRGS